jgi:hypothetical protein
MPSQLVDLPLSSKRGLSNWRTPRGRNFHSQPPKGVQSAAISLRPHSLCELPPLERFVSSLQALQTSCHEVRREVWSKAIVNLPSRSSSPGKVGSSFPGFVMSIATLQIKVVF